LLWEPLSQATFWTVSLLLRLVCREVVTRPADFVIGTPRFRVAIAPQCSGYEGIALIWVVMGIYIWQFRRTLRFPRVLLLLPLGAAVIWLANSARIAALVMIGAYVSRGVAKGGFHSQAGWLAFNAVALGLVVIAHRTRFFRTPPAITAAAAGPNAVAAYLVPFMSLIGVMMITKALSDGAGLDRLYPLRVVAAAAFLWYYRAQYTDLSWQGRAHAFTPAVFLGGVAFVVWMALENAVPPAGSQAAAPGPEQYPQAWFWLWVCFRVVGSVVVVPLAEEIAFRGYLIRRLIAADFTAVEPGRFTWFSFLISSALFGALHGRWLAGTVAGLIYAVALYRRRALADAVAAHATTNALIAGHVLTTGSWSLWM
jgi:exosortase E/protease (VPEID-CTERM system)